MENSSPCPDTPSFSVSFSPVVDFSSSGNELYENLISPHIPDELSPYVPLPLCPRTPVPSPPILPEPCPPPAPTPPTVEEQDEEPIPPPTKKRRFVKMSEEDRDNLLTGLEAKGTKNMTRYSVSLLKGK